MPLAGSVPLATGSVAPIVPSQGKPNNAQAARGFLSDVVRLVGAPARREPSSDRPPSPGQIGPDLSGRR
jgi:hypothetical protein